MRRLVLGLTATVLAAGLVPAGAGAAAAQSADIPTFGVQFHALWWDYTDEQRIALLDKLDAAGIRSVRIDVSWPSLQPRRDTVAGWYVELLDFVVDAARARGIDVLATLYRTPGWANGGSSSNVPPLEREDYAWIANWLADHFRGRVGAWEVYNEPDSDTFFAGTPQQYAAILMAAYPAFKSGDPAADVVLGGPANQDPIWLEAVYQAGARDSFDVMAVHAYMSPSDLPPETDNGTIWTLAATSMTLQLMQRYGDGGKEIWLTEYGWSAHANTGNEQNWHRGVTRKQQADYLVRSLVYLGANRPYVTKVFWYNERDRETGHPHEDGFGLLDRDLSEKPAYVAVKAFLTGGTPPPGSDVTPPTVNDLRASRQPVQEQTVVSFSLSEPANATIMVKGPSGSLVRTLASNVEYGAGPSSVTWNRRNQSGSLVAAGTYTVVVRTVDASANAASARAPVSVARLTKTVRTRSSRFFAETLTIPRGSRIKWINVSSRRHVLVKRGSWSRALLPGGTYLRAFRAKGTVSYVCRRHPGMTGTIKVV
jgi:polysaccharide biosynthesis protein PslG